MVGCQHYARPPSPPGNIPGTHFCYKLCRPKRQSAIGNFFVSEKSSDAIWYRTIDLPIYSTTRETALLPPSPNHSGIAYKSKYITELHVAQGTFSPTTLL